MRKLPRLKAWLIILGILAAASGALAFAAARTGAVAAPLWTESRQVPPSSSSPWVGVAKEDIAAVVNISTTQVVKNPMAFGTGGGSGPGDQFQDFFRLENDTGALVAQVMPNSPAAKAGVKVGDVIVEYEGHAVTKSSDLPRLVASTPIGKAAAIKVLRDGHPLGLIAQIAELSEPQEVASANPDREKLGIAVQPLTPTLAQQLGVPDRSGVVVAGVKDGSPAAEAGIQPGDVIVQANRQPVKNIADFRKALAAQKPGDPTLLQIHRKDASLFVAVTAQG